jgi:glutathione synthase/RimK-type ligase-like ATP-grasp enzyme
MSLENQTEDAAFLFKAAKNLGGQPEWLVPNQSFAVSTPHGERYINGAFSPLNSRLSSSLAHDKLLTRIILGRNSLPNIPYAAPRELGSAKAFLAEHTKVVVKPLRGSDCQDIHIVESPEQLPGLVTGGNIFERFISGPEMRYLVVQDEVLGVHRREYKGSVAADRYEQRISLPESDWDPNLMDMSRRAAACLGLGSSAVDFLVEKPTNPYILEVNSAPGIKAFNAPVSGPPVDLAHIFMMAVLAQDQ